MRKINVLFRHSLRFYRSWRRTILLFGMIQSTIIPLFVVMMTPIIILGQHFPFSIMRQSSIIGPFLVMIRTTIILRQKKSLSRYVVPIFHTTCPSYFLFLLGGGKWSPHGCISSERFQTSRRTCRRQAQWNFGGDGSRSGSFEKGHVLFSCQGMSYGLNKANEQRAAYKELCRLKRYLES